MTTEIDIPNYPNIFLIEPNKVITVNKSSGEILNEMSNTEFTRFWIHEWQQNISFREHFQNGLFTPKDDPDTATSVSELKRLCSDKTRHRKGDTGYLLDFIMNGSINKTESKVFLYLSKNVIVWNYCTTTMEEIQAVCELKTLKQTKAVWESLQKKGLLAVVNNEFQIDNEYKILVKLHPKIYWEGRFSAWAVKCKADYEYEDHVTIE